MEKIETRQIKYRPGIVFNPNDALLYGLKEAIFLNAMQKDFLSCTYQRKDDKWVLWTETKRDKYFPFWTLPELNQIIKKVEEMELIVFLKDGRKKWFQISLEPSELRNKSNRKHSAIKVTSNIEATIKKKKSEIKKMVAKKRVYKAPPVNVSIRTYCFLDSASGFYKIGQSKNPKLRLRKMKTANPSIRPVFALKENVEYLLHNKFAKKCVGGEWFSLSQEDIESIKQEYTLLNISYEMEY